MNRPVARDAAWDAICALPRYQRIQWIATLRYIRERPEVAR